MKNITLFTALPISKWKEDEIEEVHIDILTRPHDLGWDTGRIYREQANKLAKVLVETLPGMVVDILRDTLLDRQKEFYKDRKLLMDDDYDNDYPEITNGIDKYGSLD